MNTVTTKKLINFIYQGVKNKNFSTAITCWNKLSAYKSNTIFMANSSVAGSTQNAIKHRVTSSAKLLAGVGIITFALSSCTKDYAINDIEKGTHSYLVDDDISLITQQSDELPNIKDYPYSTEVDVSDKNVLYIKNNNTNSIEATLNLNKMVSGTSKKAKENIIRIIKQFSPMALLDLYNEMGDKDITDAEISATETGVDGSYNQFSDKIQIKHWSDKNCETALHELGHALSYSFDEKTNNNTFMKYFAHAYLNSFEKELKIFLEKTGQKKYDKEQTLDDVKNGKIPRGGQYFTADKDEFFAEYYKYIMNDKYPDDLSFIVDGRTLHWTEFFPKTTKLIRKYINYIRTKSIYERQKIDYNS